MQTDKYSMRSSAYLFSSAYYCISAKALTAGIYLDSM